MNISSISTLSLSRHWTKLRKNNDITNRKPHHHINMLNRFKVIQIIIAVMIGFTLFRYPQFTNFFLRQPVEKLVHFVLGPSMTIGNYHIIVDESCSAKTYFVLVLGLSALTIRPLFLSCLATILALPMVWCVNFSRIILVCGIQERVSEFVPQNTLGLIHMSLGALIFGFGLVIYMIFIDQLDRRGLR